ncbi:hypothetical protein DNTS_015690 [Danionella cerebrum]|uniref:Elastin n=1 Tax=Danionella cerebrum TaxID=2873325 RepID=A0A553QCV9_9TELE|nr:hypothetical protein DNTS_015690 [Danionella translucida]
MLVRKLLQTSLFLWLVQNSMQGGVRPQSGTLGRLASRVGPGIGAKTGVAGILGSRGYGAAKPGKTAAFRPTAIRGGIKQGYGALGYGGGLGLGAGYGLGNGLGAAMGYPAGKLAGRGYGINSYGAQLGYGVGGFPGAGRGYGLGAAGYLGAAGLADGYGAGLGVGMYPQGIRAGKQIGYSNGYGSEIYGAGDAYGAGLGYPSVLADNVGLNSIAGLGAAGLGAAGLGGAGLVVNPGLGADAKSRKYGAAGVLGAAGSLPYGGQHVVSAGLSPQGKTGAYAGTTYGGLPTLGPDTGLGGAVGQIPYNVPGVGAGLEAEVGFPFGAEQLSLGADVSKSAAKYGYAAALSTGGQALSASQKDGNKLSGIYGNGYKG